MNREIKFRIWDNANKKYLSLRDYQGLGAIEVENDGTLTLSPRYRFLTSMMIMPERFIPQQYTGLKDKNGVEVYEGDKVMFDYEWTKPDEIGVITWNKDTARFQIKGHIPSSSMKHLDRMKVIGNVYENEVD
jgi:uncharacterized phage protein (TIGR01671 family)